MMKKRLGRAVSLLLCLSLMMGMVAPAAATAAEDADDLEAGFSESQAAPQSSDSGEYEIYPTPHSVTYGTGTVTLPATMQVTYGEGIDKYTEDRAVKAFEAAGVTLSESAATDVKLQVSVNADLNPGKYDAYTVTINADGVTVVGQDTDAAFYGLTTVKRILQQVEGRQVKHLTVTDYADVPFRGFIEGYYGNPWTVDDRKALMEFGGEYKMNIYFYAPKDDPKHSTKWRELYTQEELDTKIKPLAEAGNKSKCYYGFALHPFWADGINYANEAQYAADLEVLKAKFEQVIAVGVRQIAVLADDRGLPTVNSSYTEAQNTQASYVKLLTDLTEWVSSKDMQDKYPGLKTSIPFCPNAYMNNGSSDQIKTLVNELPDSVPIVLTGGAIWGHVSHSFLDTYKTNTEGGRTFMWVNWPCSDNSKTSLTMGAHDVILHSDLTQGDINTLQGVMINPMQQSEPSKAGIFQLADYTWNIWNGSDSAQRTADVWNDCFKYVDHDSAEETPASTALRELSKHMIRQNGNGSNSYNESVELAPALTEFRTKLAAGTLTATDVANMRKEFATLNTAAKLYNKENAGNTRLLGKRNADGTYPNNLEQMAPWLDCWVEFSQANLDLLDALALMLDNGSGANDSRIVEKYLAGQSSLAASQGHKFYYVDHYETAKVGGQHLVPFTNDLLSVVADEAQTILNPSVLTETIITNRNDTPAGGLAAMRDGDPATEAVFKSPNSIAIGDYVGVRYNRPISVTSVRFEVGTAANTNDTFNDSKLQYMDESGQWVDIPGATFAHANLVLEATGLDLTTRGVRAIATSARSNTWFGIKEIYINGQSGGSGGDSEVTTGQLTGTVIRTPLWAISGNNPESNLIDGNDSTCVYYDSDGSGNPNSDNSMVGDYIGLDFGSVVENVGRVRFVIGSGSSDDKWTDFKLQYSTDNVNWTDVNTYNSTHQQDIIEEDLGGVAARYVRFVNTKQIHKWLYFAELSVWADNSSAIVYRSEKLGRLAKPVGTLADDSASLKADLVMLRPGEFVGIALPRIRAITGIVANYSDAPGVVLEVGMSEDSMTVVAPADLAAYTGNARYIRLRNADPTQTASFKLNELSVQSEEFSGISYVSANGCQPESASDDPMAWFDGDVGTRAKFATVQSVGNWVLYDLGQTRTIRSLRATINNTDNDYPRNGVWEVSASKSGPWTPVLTITTTLGVGQTDYNNPPSTNGSTEWQHDTANYFYQENTLQTPVSGRYLRYRVTSASNNYLRFNEVTINGGEYVPTANDPTFVADPIEQAGYAPANMRDGDLTTAFRPNMTGKTSGSVIYRLSDETSIGQINVLADANCSGEVFVREVGGERFVRLGTLGGGLTQLSVPAEFVGLAEIKLTWGNTTPTIYELITVARDKVGEQASSDNETVPINSYSGNDCSILFDENWKFNLGDASGAQAKVYNDSAWRTVNLPHDYGIEQSYTSAGEAESGYLIGGIGWYRKSFIVDPDWEGRTVTIDFGGAYMDTEVYLNGTKLGEHHYGYSPFSFVLPSDVLDYTGENVIAVKTNDSFPSSRWYCGAGIYRSVHLTVSDPVHVAKYGTYVTTTNAGAVTVETTVQNDGASEANVTVEQAIYELNGTTFEKGSTAVASVTGTKAVSAAPAANGTAKVTQILNVASPKLWNTWDKGTPNLYVLVTTVNQGNTVLDTYETEFGFREIDWEVDKGFKLNGDYLKLKGVCQHHDQGALGSEAWYRALERQVDILMDMGVNSIRVTHNPAADELIEICNRKGVLIIDELFDGWAHAKNGNSGDFSRWFNQPLGEGNNLVGGSANMKWKQFVAEAVVNRDKNAPCVIMYSLCNEVQEGGGIDSNYPTYASELIGWIQAIDDTRYITRGDNSRTASTTGNQGLINKAIHDAGGAVGFNYYGGSDNPIEPGHNLDWLMYAAETVSHINSRGVYNVKGSGAYNSDKLLTSYDKSAVSWGTVASNGWWRTIRYDYSAGEYIWTGFDYIGEPTPSNGTGTGWASGENSPKNSFFGAIDTNGLPKDNYWLYRSMWNDTSHTLHILPTWDRDDIIIDSSGKVEVVVYTDAPMVKLYLNDQVVGTATSTTHTTAAGHVYRTFNSGTEAFVPKAETSHETLYATFNVTYEPGTLEVKAFEADGTTPITDTEGRSVVKTTSGASKLVVEADRTTIKNDGRDLSYITISVTDENGNIVNGAKNAITVNVTGNGVFMGLDNGVQPDHTSYLSQTRNAGAGQLVAIVQSTKAAGTFTVTATAAGLEQGSVTVTTGGAASTVGDDTPVSYDITKTIYVQRGVEPELPEKATVTLGNKSRVEKNVAWGSYNKSLLNTVGSEFAITGTIAEYNIPVSVGVVVMDEVAALLNYSTAIRVGGELNLPATRPAVMADGTVLNAQFPVAWEMPPANAFVRQGTVEIHGAATVFGKTLDVTAWVRVTEGGVAVGGSVSGDVVKRPAVDSATDEDLLNAYDGDPETVWTGKGTTRVEFDTQQNLYRIVLTYQDAVPASGVTLNLESGAVTVSPTIDDANKTATYELGGIRASEYVTIAFSDIVKLADVALILATPTFEVYSTAELDGLRFNGENAPAAELASRAVTTSLMLPAIVPVSGSNVAYTILPEDNGTVIIVTESENQANRDLYTVYLGGEGQQYNDYPYNKTTASAGSDNGNTVGSAVDGNENTIWHSAYDNGSEEAQATTKLANFPEKRWFQLTLDDTVDLVALRYKPRNSQTNGTVHEYEIKTSLDGIKWELATTGTWDSSSAWKIATFDKVKAKYVRLKGVSTYGDSTQANYFMSAAEVRVVMAEKEDLSPAMVTVTPAEQHWRNVPLEATNVTVTLFGKELTEGVDYELSYENNRDVGTAYVYAVAKADSDYQGSAYGTFTIKMAEVSGDGLEKRTIWIQEGVKPELPETIRAAMSDGHHQEWEVKWDDIPEGNYIKPTKKQFTVEGTVAGTTEKAELTVNVAYAISVDGVSAMTAGGAAPALPSVVNVQFEDGVSRECRVTWDLADKDWSAEGIVTVDGTLENIDPSRLKASASVRVGTATANDTKNIALNDSTATYSADKLATLAEIFPFAMGYVSAGNNNPYQAIKGTTSGSTAGTDRWSDWERNALHNPIWMGVAFETSTELSGRQQNQTLTLVPHLVNKAKVMFVDENGSTNSSVTFPDSYKLQYYTGPVENLTFDTRISNVDEDWGNGRVRGWTDSPLNIDSNWKDVTVKGTQPAVPSANGTMLTVEFEPVNTAIIRVVCVPKSGKWVGVQALEVYGMDPPTASNSINVETITLGRVDKTAAFDSSANKVLEIELEENDDIPQLAVTVDSADNASVSIIQASRVPGKAEAGGAWAVARITAEDGETTQTYTVKFTRKGLEDKKYIINKVVKPEEDAGKVTLDVPNPSQVDAETVVTISVNQAGYRLAAPWVTVDKCYHADNDHQGQYIDVEDNKFTMPMGDVTLTTSITPISYKITYNLDGGEMARVGRTEYTVETATFTMDSTPTKAGYTFQGWTGTGITSDPVKSVTINKGSTGDLTYTANWSPVTYNINCNLNGGTVSVANPTTYTAEDATFTLNTPTRDGYIFVGWQGTGLTGDPVKTVAIAKGSTGHRSYTAVWTAGKDELNEAITAANTAKMDIEGRPEGTAVDQVEKGIKFVPQNVMDALNEALTNARKVVSDPEATQEQVDEAKTALTEATAAFEKAIQTGTKDDSGVVTPPADVSKDELNDAIADAEAAKTANGLVTKPTGTTVGQVDKGTKFVTQDTLDALTNAIAKAQAVADNPNATQAQVDDAKAVLEAAVSTFNHAVKTGEKEDVGQTVSKDELNDAIADAEAAKTANGLVTKPTGTTVGQVDKGTKFVTQDTVDALTNAIAKAQAVADDPSATQAQVDDAKAALEAAVETFNHAVQTGTKDDGGSTVTPPAPVNPGPGGTSGGATTTTTNPDGSTTTTVTDKNSGTVTETTERKDGTVEVVETKKDGTVTETTKNADGSSEAVEKKPDGTVTETTTDKDGAKVEKVTTPEKDVAIIVTDKEGDVLVKVEIPSQIPEPETRFVDVPEGHWADEAIHNMAALEVVKGVGNNTFNRNGDMKRGDLALVLSRMSSNERNSYELTFADVPTTKYYADGVAWAAKTGVVTGRSADTFAPEDTITREELAVMLYRYAKLLNIDTSASNVELDVFTDGGRAHSWAANGVAWCVKNGILRGKGNGVLDPRTNVTRAEVAVMLQRFMDLMK